VNKIFDKLFKKQRSANMDVATVPLSREQLDEVTEDLSPIPVLPPQFICGAGQSVGVQRDHNEDTLFVLNTILSDGKSQVPFGVFIVADGMGGHQFGEVASSVATRAMSETIIKHLYLPLLGSWKNEQADSIQEVMEKGIYEAQEAVVENAPGGGTTMTAALIIGQQMTFAHVGDSRAYIISANGQVEVVTQDHSLVNRLIQMGQITKEEAAVHPQKNILYRAIGQNEPLQPDIKNVAFPTGSTLMLCSDGLWGVVSEETIATIIKDTPTLTEACHLLVEAANAGGGPDNISVVLVRYLE
jgi:PPM family protein phosphatase